MHEIIKVTLKAIFAYLYLVIIARLIGRKIIAQMTFLDFALATSFGSLIAVTTLGSSPSSLSGFDVILTFSILSILTSVLNVKSIKFRKFVNSEPIVVIEEGKIIDENMVKTKLSLSELNSLLRKQNAFNIADVEFAVFEIDGQLSVLKKSEKQPVTPADMKIKTSSQALTKDLIMDGVIMHENLKCANLDGKWLAKELKDHGIKGEKDVFYAGLDSSRKLYIAKRSKDSETQGEHGIE